MAGVAQAATEAAAEALLGDLGAAGAGSGARESWSPAASVLLRSLRLVTAPRFVAGPRAPPLPRCCPALERCLGFRDPGWPKRARPIGLEPARPPVIRETAENRLPS